MFRTTFPQEAVGRAHNLAFAYQFAQVGLAQLTAEFRSELRPVIDRLGTEAAPYLREVRGRIRWHADVAVTAEPLLPDRIANPMVDRLIVASRALMDAVEDEAVAKGLDI